MNETPQVVKILVAAGADAGAAGSDAQNYTALHGPSFF